jgi:hypothetical protein
MRTLIAIVVAAGILTTAKAQITPQMFAPTPFGVVMTVGQWLLTNNKRVYYIEVQGQGVTAEEARMNGFRLAVEQALGSVIASETEQQNSRIRRDEVISYAAGFVERFEIVSTIHTGSVHEIAMRVWIQRTNLAERLLVTSRADGQIDGARAAVAVETTQYSRSQGDRLLATVLNDFPKRSFDIKVRPIEIEMDTNRNPLVVVAYHIKWNRQYEKSVIAAQKAVGMWCSGWGEKCPPDQAIKDLHWNNLVGSNPHVLVNITSDSGESQWRACFKYEELSEFQTEIRGYTRIPVSAQELKNMNRVEITVVRHENCSARTLVGYKY